MLDGLLGPKQSVQMLPSESGKVQACRTPFPKDRRREKLNEDVATGDTKLPDAIFYLMIIVSLMGLAYVVTHN